MLEAPATPRVDLQAALMPAPAALPAVPAPAWSCPAFEVLDLTQVTLVASGSERDVYLHPGDKSLLIKIVNRARINEPGRKRPWHKRLHREDAHRVFITELVEYIATTVQQLQAAGMSAEQAYAQINRLIDQQAFTRAADDIFLASSFLFLSLIVLIWFTQRPKAHGGGGADAAAPAAPTASARAMKGPREQLGRRAGVAVVDGLDEGLQHDPFGACLPDLEQVVLRVVEHLESVVVVVKRAA